MLNRLKASIGLLLSQPEQGLLPGDRRRLLSDALIDAEATEARRMADSWVSDVVPTQTPTLAQAEREQDPAEEIEVNPAVPVTERREITLARLGPRQQ